MRMQYHLIASIAIGNLRPKVIKVVLISTLMDKRSKELKQDVD